MIDKIIKYIGDVGLVVVGGVNKYGWYCIMINYIKLKDIVIGAVLTVGLIVLGRVISNRVDIDELIWEFSKIGNSNGDEVNQVIKATVAGPPVNMEIYILIGGYLCLIVPLILWYHGVKNTKKITEELLGKKIMYINEEPVDIYLEEKYWYPKLLRQWCITNYIYTLNVFVMSLCVDPALMLTLVDTGMKAAIVIVTMHTVREGMATKFKNVGEGVKIIGKVQLISTLFLLYAFFEVVREPGITYEFIIFSISKLSVVFCCIFTIQVVVYFGSLLFLELLYRWELLYRRLYLTDNLVKLYSLVDYLEEEGEWMQKYYTDIDKNNKNTQLWTSIT